MPLGFSIIGFTVTFDLFPQVSDPGPSGPGPLVNYRIVGFHHVFAVDRCLGTDSDSESSRFSTDFRIVFDKLGHS